MAGMSSTGSEVMIATRGLGKIRVRTRVLWVTTVSEVISHFFALYIKVNNVSADAT